MNKDLLGKIRKDIIDYGLTLKPKERIIVHKILNIILKYYFIEDSEKLEKEEDLYEYGLTRAEHIILDKVNEIIDYINKGGSNE